MKCHLLDSDEPLKEFTSLTALCGKEIQNAVFVIRFNHDVTSFAESLNRINTCAQCLDVELGKRYVYGLVSGQEYVSATEAA